MDEKRKSRLFEDSNSRRQNSDLTETDSVTGHRPAKLPRKKIKETGEGKEGQMQPDHKSPGTFAPAELRASYATRGL